MFVYFAHMEKQSAFSFDVSSLFVVGVIAVDVVEFCSMSRRADRRTAPHLPFERRVLCYWSPKNQFPLIFHLTPLFLFSALACLSVVMANTRFAYYSDYCFVKSVKCLLWFLRMVTTSLAKIRQLSFIASLYGSFSLRCGLDFVT